MPTAVITGANSVPGIGHSLSKILLREGYKLYAVDVTSGSGLADLASSGAITSSVDVTSPSSIQTFQTSLANTPIDLLLNVAGIAVAADALTTATLPDFQRVFAVNTYGPMFLTQALLPNLLAASAPKVGIVTSRMGSIGDNSSGGQYAYRASKAAVNSIGKSLAIDLRDKGVAVMLLHPGITKTNILPKGLFPEGATTPDETAEKLWEVVEKTQIEDTGKFWHRDGYELPW